MKTFAINGKAVGVTLPESSHRGREESQDGDGESNDPGFRHSRRFVWVNTERRAKGRAAQ